MKKNRKNDKGSVAKYPFWLISQKFGCNLLKNTHSSSATTPFFQLRFAKIFEKLSQKFIRQQTPKIIFGSVFIATIFMFMILPPLAGAAVLSIFTDPASNADETRAQLNGYVSAVGSGWTEVWFEYGKTSEFENTTHKRTIKNEGKTFSENVSGLSPDTAYFVRISARDATGTYRGDTISFRTDATTYGLPSVYTESVRTADDDSALLRGSINAHGDKSAQVWFEWGRDTSLGNQTAFIGHDGTSQSAVSLIGGLSPNTRYYYRLVAQGGAGIAYGDIRYFDTEKITESVSLGEPSITTGKATLLSDGEIASLSGFVDTKRVSTETWFDWGETTYLGNTTRRSAKRTDTGSFSETISGLKEGTLYYYRAAGSNENGTAYGLIKTVTSGDFSDSNVSAQIVVSAQNIIFPASAQTNRAEVSSATSLLLRGTANTGGGLATAWFEWGADTSLGNMTLIKFLGNIPSQGVSESLFGLSPNTTYFYRFVVSNEKGKVFGVIQNAKTVTETSLAAPIQKDAEVQKTEPEPIPDAPKSEPNTPASVFFGGDVFGKYTPEWILSIFFLFVLGLAMMRKI